MDDRPGGGRDTGGAPRGDASSGVPRWVKVFGIVLAGLVLLAVLAVLLSGGRHGPGRHLGISAVAACSTVNVAELDLPAAGAPGDGHRAAVGR